MRRWEGPAMRTNHRTFILAVAAFVSTVFIDRAASAVTMTASGCSVAAVQAAVNSAADGDTVVIPNGACVWTSGISTTKQIQIRAQNSAPVAGGRSTQSVVITNNSTTPLFDFT